MASLFSSLTRARLYDFFLLSIPVLTLISGIQLTISLAVLALIAMVPFIITQQPEMGVKAFRRATRSALVLFLLWALLSSLWSIDGSGSFEAIVRIMLLCALGTVAFMLHHTMPATSFALQKIYVVLFAACVALLALEHLPLPHGALLAAISDALGGDFAEYTRKTVNRGLCAFAVLVWPAMHLLYGMGKRTFAWALFATTAIAILGFNSMSAQLGLVLSFAVFMFCRFAAGHGARVLVVVVPLACVAVPFFTFAIMKSPSFAPHYAEVSALSAGRLPIWSALEPFVKEKPLLGWGADMSEQMPMSDETLASLGLEGPPMHPHLSALQVQLELGVVGLVLAALALAQIIRRVGAATQGVAQAMALACVVAYAGAGLSSFAIWQNWWVATAWLAVLLWQRASART